MARVFNFAAGPATMPPEVLARIRADLPDWQGLGMSVLEAPFTGPAFRDVAARAESRLRDLLAVPANYRILFLHGGAMAQFALVPLNLLGARFQADYVETGYWSGRAMHEAERYCRVNIAASGRESGFSRIPPRAEWRLDPVSAYCHITSNETVDGVAFSFTPETGAVPLVADMTSDFLSRPVEVSRFGLIYASAQKNVGPSALTIVILREDLLGRAHPLTPSVFDYRVQVESGSLYNTPNTFGLYVAALVFDWIEAKGGLPAMAAANARKSAALYAAIDAGGFYRAKAEPGSRSQTNVCFTLAEPALIDRFVSEAAQAGLVNLAGHRFAGGLRASLYNAMPEEGVALLVEFLRDFARRHG